MARQYKKRMPEGPFYKDLGRTIRLARVAAGKSLMDTADHLDIAFQQLQKYESATNRIPIDRLVSLAEYLDVPLSRFVAPAGPADADAAFLSLIGKFEAKEFRTLLESWTSITDRHARTALLNLVKSMAALSR